MDAGPGTDLGGLGWFLGIWVTMMAVLGVTDPSEDLSPSMQMEG